MELKKLVLITTTVLGASFVLANVAFSVLLAYQISQFSIASSTEVTLLFGTMLFLIASVVLVILGAFLVLGGVYSYKWSAPEGIASLGILLGSLYLLFLGIGSILLHPSVESMLLILGAVFFMTGTAAYMATAFDFKLIGSFMMVAGGILLAMVLFNYSILGEVFSGWDVPFLGPFMSMTFMEAIVVILAPAALFIDLVVKRWREKSTAQIFFPIVTLLYGMSIFIGTFFLTLNLWNILWKAPWVGPLYAAPYWVFIATVFWSVTLIILAVAGIFVGVSSFLVFADMVRELSVEEGFSQLLPSTNFQRQSRREKDTSDKYTALKDLISSTQTKRSYPFVVRKREETQTKRSYPFIVRKREETEES